MRKFISFSALLVMLFALPAFAADTIKIGEIATVTGDFAANSDRHRRLRGLRRRRSRIGQDGRCRNQRQGRRPRQTARSRHVRLPHEKRRHGQRGAPSRPAGQGSRGDRPG